MKHLKRFLPAITIVFALTASVISAYMFVTRPKTAYVNLTQLYNEFELKKNLEQELTTVQQLRQKTLDSLELGLKSLSRNIQAIDAIKLKDEYNTRMAEFENRKQEYLYKQKSFGDDNANLSDRFSSQIWKQLNQYVKDFGEANHYTYIMGGDGTGSMMYANQSDDLTQTLVAYTNSRYKGETKTR
jgi:outer membrane protein